MGLFQLIFRVGLMVQAFKLGGVSWRFCLMAIGRLVMDLLDEDWVW